MDKILTYETWTDFNLKIRDDDLIEQSLEVLKWAYDAYDEKIVYACSFGAEGIVLIDLISKVKKDAQIVFLDTDLHFTETYELINKIKALYPNLSIRLIKSKLSLEEQERKFGANLWERRPNQCCYYRKIVPLEEELAKYTAWISGLRRDQSETRRKVEFVNKDERFQSIKICPLIYWSWDDVWDYIYQHKLPYNPLHDHDYPSIGCSKCTWTVKDGKNLRSGRWVNSNKTECGLHTS